MRLGLYDWLTDAMNADQLAVLKRIEEFSLDIPGALFPFSKKLALENHWSIAYARRVIEEYKRFAFLAVVSGHAVSPSEPVDQAWHMHLTYSQSYWKVFCPEVLGMPLHHNPTRGGKAEHEKFEDWYQRTLESYRAFFGSDPPADIWPTPEERRMSKSDFVRVDKAEHWVIRKPKLTNKGRLSTVAALSLFVAGCSGAVTSANPFNWDGPTFLQFYVILFPICLAIALFARYALRTPAAPAGGPPLHLSGYQLAYLNGGSGLAIQAAIASLVRKGFLAVSPGNRLVMPTAVPYQADRDFEAFVYSRANSPSGVPIGQIYATCMSRAAEIGEELKPLGLVVSDSQIATMKLVPFVIALIAPLVGVVKIAVGISRERPVSDLIVLCLFSLLITAIVLLRGARRSRYGDAVISQFRDRYAHMRHIGHHQSSMSSDELLIAVGLFGLPCLVGSDMNYLVQTFQPAGSGGSSSGCGGSSGSSCSGGGDGGGGGCGGGGGGCGGCSGG